MSPPSDQPSSGPPSPLDPRGGRDDTPPRAPNRPAEGQPGEGHPQSSHEAFAVPAPAERLPAPLRIALAWFIILALSIGWIAMHTLGEQAAEDSAPPAVSLPMQMGGRVMHSVVRWADAGGTTPEEREQLLAMALTQVEPQKDAPWTDRVAFTIVEAEMRSPTSAIESLDALGVPAGASDADHVLFRSVRDGLVEWSKQVEVDAPSSEASETREPSEPASAAPPAPRLAVPEPEAARLGWFAQLLAGTAPPTNLIFYLAGALLWYVVFVLAGLVILGIGLTFVLMGKLRSRIELTGQSAIYAETFAVWLLLFFALQIGLAQLLHVIDPEISKVPAGLAGMFGSLAALAWPVFRGVPWAEVRRDIGLNAGTGFFRECALGPITYAASLPIMGLGFVAFAVLRKAFGETEQPSHPVVEQLGEGTSVLISIFVLACIAAPIVEEIAFRGILYRHLREAGRLVGTVASVLFATVVSSALFAAIHPQGFLFVPILGGLASGFCLAREARGSILSGIVAHAINNAFTLALGVAISQG